MRFGEGWEGAEGGGRGKMWRKRKKRRERSKSQGFVPGFGLFSKESEAHLCGLVKKYEKE